MYYRERQTVNRALRKLEKKVTDLQLQVEEERKQGEHFKEQVGDWRLLEILPQTPISIPVFAPNLSVAFNVN